MDFGLCSPSLLFKFIDFLQEECKLGYGGRLGYVDAISELIDFRKVNGASDASLRKLFVTELYLKRARKTVAKMIRLQWTQDFDIETLYLFIKVKGSPPMTYQYLTLDMIATAKEKDGFIDQKTFKTAGKYGFDSLILTDANMQVLNS